AANTVRPSDSQCPSNPTNRADDGAGAREAGDELTGRTLLARRTGSCRCRRLSARATRAGTTATGGRTTAYGPGSPAGAEHDSRGHRREVDAWRDRAVLAHRLDRGLVDRRRVDVARDRDHEATAGAAD